MQINRKELIDALARVKPGLANKEIVEQSTSFAFDKDSVITFNDEIAVSHPIKTNLLGAVQAEELYKLLNKSSSEEIEFEINDGELKIIGKRSKSGIRLDDEIKLPLSEISKPKEWTPISQKFLDALQFCIFSASRDMTRPILTCLHITSKYIETTDNHRITRYKLDKCKLKEEVLLPASSAKEIPRYYPREIAVSDGWVHFRNEEKTVISARTHHGKYPDPSTFLDVEGSEIELPEELAEALERAMIFAKNNFEQDEVVLIKIKKNWLTVRGEGTVGWHEEKIRVKYDDDEIEFYINPQFLLQILQHLNKVVINDVVLKFVGDEFDHVLCQVSREEGEDSEEEE
jgi:DNA polymerase III sliding clamp (beta) subunit (PCNA family)